MLTRQQIQQAIAASNGRILNQAWANTCKAHAMYKRGALPHCYYASALRYYLHLRNSKL